MEDDEVHAFICDAYLKGKSQKWIANKLGISGYSVTRALKEGGVTTRPPRVSTRAGMRVCRYCEQELPLADFVKNARKSQGYDYLCRQCKKDQYESRKGAT